MVEQALERIAYFPGCSLATTAQENNQSMIAACRTLGYELTELADWNCCGSSSAHSVNSALAWRLAARNLALVPEGQTLLVACPSCLLRLSQTHLHIDKSASLRARYQETFSRAFDPELKIIHFFELLDSATRAPQFKSPHARLKGLKVAPYYGCMLARPPEMGAESRYWGLMERILTRLGARPVRWPYPARCCGTFLSAVRPDIITPMVNEINEGAALAQADCLVTACAMCHMNLEIRCTTPNPLPVFHFSELLALALGLGSGVNWFQRHLIDPRPVLRSAQLI